MRSQRVKQIFKQVAEEEGLTVEQVKEIAESPFRLVASIMKSGDRDNVDFKNVRITKFGIFAVKEGRKKYLKEKNNEKANRARQK